MGHDIEVLRVVPVAPPFAKKWRKYRALGEHYTCEGIPVTVARTLILPRMCNFEHLRLQTGGIIRHAIERFEPDIVHAHYLLYPGSISVGRGRPTVITSHGIDAYDWPWRRVGLRREAVRTLQRADTVVGVSGFIANCLRRLESRPVEVIFNGADMRTFAGLSKSRARAALQIPEDRAVLSFVGHLVPEKGIFDLVAALRPLEKPPLLLLAGEGPAAETLARALRAARIEARLLGYVKHDVVANVVAASDALTLPSHNEGLPVTVCEAMLAGKPVIATTVGGIPEIIRDGETGFLAESRDIARLTYLYDTVFRDKERMALVGQRAYEFARQHLTWEANARAYDRLYSQLVRRRAA